MSERGGDFSVSSMFSSEKQVFFIKASCPSEGYEEIFVGRDRYELEIKAHNEFHRYMRSKYPPSEILEIPAPLGIIQCLEQTIQAYGISVEEFCDAWITSMGLTKKETKT